MPRLLKQSTAVTFRIGPFVDSTDGVTAETGLTIAQADIQISKAGGAFAQTSATTPTTTHDADGWYQCPLTATDTGTLGMLTVQITMAGALPVWEHFEVVAANIYDSVISGTDLVDVNVAQWNGSAVATPTTAGVPEVDITHIAGSAVSTSAAQLGVNVVNIEGSDATDQINAACDAAIETYNLHYVLHTALPTNWATDITANSALDYMADDGTAAYDRTTDSLQAIADSGGGGPTAAQIADAVWDEAQADHVGAGTFGETATEIASILADTGTDGVVVAAGSKTGYTISGTITTLDALDTAQDSQHAATQALVATVDTVVDGIQTDLSNATDGLGAIKADTAAILTDTGTTIPGTITTLQATADAIETDTQDIQTRIPAALVGGRIDANVGAISASQAAADQLELNVEATLAGTASGTPTTTSMVSDVAVTVDDQFKGRIIVFQSDTTTAALRNQATDITACTAASNTLTFTALTTAPSSGDTFVII